MTKYLQSYDYYPLVIWLEMKMQDLHTAKQVIYQFSYAKTQISVVVKTTHLLHEKMSCS